MNVNHPEVFIFPMLILADYFLTVGGAILSEKKYRQHFKFENYELNPIWQKNIAEKRWLSPKFLLSVAAVTVFCFVWAIIWSEDDPVFEGLFGFCVVLSSSLIGYHLTNILTFNYLAHHADSISGEVVMSHLLILKMAQFRSMGLMFILIVVAVFSPTPFVVGGVCSQIFLVFIEARWFAKAKAAERKKFHQ